MEGRYIDNPYLDKSFNNDSNTFESVYNNELHTVFSNSLLHIEEELKNNQPSINDDNTIYTGITGLCFYYLLKYLKLKEGGEVGEQLSLTLNNCKELYNKIIKDKIKKKSKKNRITFLSGDNGLLTIGIILNFIDSNLEEFNNLFNELINQTNEIIENENDEYPYELLYGKCGYIQCLLLIKRYCKSSYSSSDDSLNIEDTLKVLDKNIELLVLDVVNYGRKYSKDNKSDSPLMYQWHKSEYLGGVHGLAGILYILISALELIGSVSIKSIENDIIGSLDFLISTMLPSGNFPSRQENTNDRLVQFCHGAPGVIPTLVKAYSYFNNNNKYFESAKLSSNVIWKFGLLVKGSGLCHGISGNIYSFLLIYLQDTNDLSYLYKSISFTKLLLTKSFFNKLHDPDCPYSLFEGLGGLVCLLNDLSNLYKFKNNNNFLKKINFPTL